MLQVGGEVVQVMARMERIWMSNLKILTDHDAHGAYDKYNPSGTLHLVRIALKSKYLQMDH